MRTAIFLGLLYIASAIDKNCFEGTVEFAAIITIILMFMDVIEFIKKKIVANNYERGY